MKMTYLEPEFIIIGQAGSSKLCALSVIEFAPGASFEAVEFTSIEDKGADEGGWDDKWLD